MLDEECLAYKKASHNDAKRKVEEPAKDARVAEAAKEPASAGERPLAYAHLTDQEGRGEEVKKGATDSMQPQGVAAGLAVVLEEAFEGSITTDLSTLKVVLSVPPAALPTMIGSHGAKAGDQKRQ